MTVADRILIAVLGVAIVLGYLVVPAFGGEAGVVTFVGPQGETSLPLNRDARAVVQGRLGDVVVTVEDGSVRVTDATCPDHVCIHTGAVTAPGSVIACVPNGVIVRVGGVSADEFDARLR